MHILFSKHRLPLQVSVLLSVYSLSHLYRLKKHTFPYQGTHLHYNSMAQNLQRINNILLKAKTVKCNLLLIPKPDLSCTLLQSEPKVNQHNLKNVKLYFVILRHYNSCIYMAHKLHVRNKGSICLAQSNRQKEQQTFFAYMQVVIIINKLSYGHYCRFSAKDLHNILSFSLDPKN